MDNLANTLPCAVQWSEGMLLSPQHMQQNDIYWHQQLHHLAAALQPYAWGLVQLKLKDSALADGQVVVEKLHAVMPDGLVVQYPGSYTEPLALKLPEPREWKESTALRVFLAVPVRAEGAASVTSRIQRYDAIPGALEVDENTGEGRIEVDRLRPRLALVPARRVPARYTAIPLVEIVLAAGHFHVGRYHPPMLRAGAGEFLGPEHLERRLLRLTQDIRARIRDLAGARRVDENITGLPPETRQQLFAARHLAAALPAFELRLRSGVAHPYDLYLALAGMVGTLAALGANPSPPLLDVYDHDFCLAGFDGALDFVRARLALALAPFQALPFDRVAEGHFARVLPEDLPLDRLIVEVRLRDGQDEAALRRWLAHTRIGSADVLAELERRRLHGASLQPLDARRRGGLNVAADALLYELGNRPIEIGDQPTTVVHAGAALAIKGPAEGAPREILLHRARPAGPPPIPEPDGHV